MPWLEKKDLVGTGCFFAGIALLAGWFFTDKVHGVEKVLIIAAVVLMIFGAHLISSGPTEAALKSLASAAKQVLPGLRGGSDPPAPGA